MKGLLADLQIETDKRKIVVTVKNVRFFTMLIFSEKFNPTVLAIGAHPDDIELGAGGFICRRCIPQLRRLVGQGAEDQDNTRAAHGRRRVFSTDRSDTKSIGAFCGSVRKYRDCGQRSNCGRLRDRRRDR